jgi:hypothetical protein
MALNRIVVGWRVGGAPRRPLGTVWRNIGRFLLVVDLQTTKWRGD